MLIGLEGDVGMDDVLERLKTDGEFALEPCVVFENLDGTPFVTIPVSPFDVTLLELGNKLFELLLDAGL